jgi:hypothetical protein
MIHIEDYEREAQKDLVYLQEDMLAFYSSLNDPGKAQVEAFMSDKQPMFDRQMEEDFSKSYRHRGSKVDIKIFKFLQQEAKLNIGIPASIIVRGDRRLIKYYECKAKALSF